MLMSGRIIPTIGEPNIPPTFDSDLELSRSQQTPSSNNTREDSTHGHHQMVNTESRLLILHQQSVQFIYSVVSNSLQPHGLQPTMLLRPWDSPGKNTGVGCQFFLQGIFSIQELNPGLLYCRQILYQVSYNGRPIFQQVWDINHLLVTETAFFLYS